MFKFVLDENITILENLLPKNVLNARELYFRNQIRQYGIKDGHLLKMARKQGYTIITKDMGLVIKANNVNENIVYVLGPNYGKQWFLIPGSEKIGNRLRLKKYMATHEPVNSTS